MKNSDSTRVLSKEECQEFYSRWDDEETKKEFFNHNIRLVHYIAGKYSNTDLDYDDLFQCAGIGLWKAIKTFEPSKGYQFATYASRVMNNEILMLLRSSKKMPIIDEKRITSIDTPLSVDYDGNKLTLEDVLISSGLGVDDDLLGEGLSAVIREYLSKYKPRDVEIVRMHMDGKTQRIIADQMHLSQSYISRIINKFKRDMKKHIRTHWSSDII